MRIAVTGGRDFANATMVVHALSQMPPDAVLVHGAASGADSLCAEWWGDIHRRTVEPHPADWEAPCRPECRIGHRRTRANGGPTYCPAAGVYRNQDMLESCLDLLIAFPGGRGTDDMVRRTTQAGVKCIDLRRRSVGTNEPETRK